MTTPCTTTTRNSGAGLIADSCTAATSPSSAFTAFVLGRLRCAHIRMRLALNAIDAAGIALKGGLIDGETALACLAESGLLDFVTRRSS